MSNPSSPGNRHRDSGSYCYRLDPTQDPRWARLVERHPKASVFHTVGWLNALRRAYAYEPVVYTTSSPVAELENGLVFCRVNSWLTGHRLVSLPFSDHCEPLCDSVDDLNFLIRYLKSALAHQNWRYLELRPINQLFPQTSDSSNSLSPAAFFLHILDLRPDLDRLFRKLDKDSVQRRIRRAERAGLVEKCGRSDELLKEFYALFVLTRGRHRLPAPPFAWLETLIACLGEAVEIRVAYKGNTAISAILTLRYKDTVYYKYGCSRSHFNNFGGMPWLLWRAIAAGKADGATKFDMGRSEEGNEGLVRFKNHWVPEPHRLVYWRFPDYSSRGSSSAWKLAAAKCVFSCMPAWSRTVTGRLIYRHIG